MIEVRKSSDIGKQKLLSLDDFELLDTMGPCSPCMAKRYQEEIKEIKKQNHQKMIEARKSSVTVLGTLGSGKSRLLQLLDDDFLRNIDNFILIDMPGLNSPSYTK